MYSGPNMKWYIRSWERPQKRSATTRSLVGLEGVVLLDPDPRKPAAAGECVSAAGVLLLGIEQLEPGGEPLLGCSCPMVGHAFSFRRGTSLCSTWPVPASDGGPRLSRSNARPSSGSTSRSRPPSSACFSSGCSHRTCRSSKARRGSAARSRIRFCAHRVPWRGCSCSAGAGGRSIPLRARHPARAAVPHRHGGNAANLYDTIDWWDDANHFVNWGLLVAAFCSCCIRLPLGRLAGAAIAVGFGRGDGDPLGVRGVLRLHPQLPEARRLTRTPWATSPWASRARWSQRL